MSTGLGWAGLAVTAGSAALSYKGTKDAAKEVAGASKEASDVVRQNYQDSAERLDPYSANVADAMKVQRDIAGVNGPEAQAAYYESLGSSPRFQFVRDQGMKTQGQQAMLTGTLKSGSRLKSINEFLKGLEMQFSGNDFNQAGAIVGTGLAADSAIAGVGQNAAVTQAGIITNNGMEQANARLGRSAALQSGIADLAAIGASGGFNFGGGGNRASSTWQGTPQINAGAYA